MSNKSALIIGLLVIAGFAIGIWQLFSMRYESGDVYPLGSSLRADPAGTRAFYEALDLLPDVKASRNFTPFDLLDAESGNMWFMGGTDTKILRQASASTVDRFETICADDGRLVILMLPAVMDHLRDMHEGTLQMPVDESLPERLQQQNLLDVWGIGFKEFELEDYQRWNDFSDYAMPTADYSADFQTVSWRSAFYFSLENADDWQVIYRVREQPVLIERRWEGGTVVLGTDTWFASNEGVREARPTALLSWLVGSHYNVVFDEAHLNVAHRPGVAELIVEYRLHGVVIGFFVLALLFIWRNTQSLLPRRETAEAEPDFGRDSTAGLINLLKRSIGKPDLLAHCYVEWQAAHREKLDRNSQKLADLEATLLNDDEARKQIVDSYNHAVTILSHRTKL